MGEHHQFHPRRPDHLLRASLAKIDGAWKPPRLVERLHELAVACGATPAQFAIAWLLHQGADIVPHTGCNRVADLEENLAAIDLAIDPAQLTGLVDALPDAEGERYDAGGMRTVGH